MAIVECIPEKKQTPSAQKGVIDYCMQPSKTVDEDEQVAYVSGYNCIPEMANESFLATQKVFGHEPDGVRFYHYVQSFKVGEDITPREVHEITQAIPAARQPAQQKPSVRSVTRSTAKPLHIPTPFLKRTTHITGTSAPLAMQLTPRLSTTERMMAIAPRQSSVLAVISLPKQKQLTQAARLPVRQRRTARYAERHTANLAHTASR